MTSYFLNVAINHFVYTMSENSWKCLLHFSRDQVDLFKCPVLTDQPSQAYKNSHYASAPGIAVAYGIMRSKVNVTVTSRLSHFCEYDISGALLIFKFPDKAP